MVPARLQNTQSYSDLPEYVVFSLKIFDKRFVKFRASEPGICQPGNGIQNGTNYLEQYLGIVVHLYSFAY